MKRPDSESGQSPHWANIQEAGSLLGIRLLHGLYRLGGRRAFSLLLYPVMAYFYWRRPVARQASREYLQRLQQQGLSGTLSSFQHFLAFGHSLLDRLLCWQPSPRLGPIALQQPAKAAPGLILTAHIGNMELSRILASRQPGVRINILLHSTHAERFNRMLRQLNPDSQINLLQVTDLNPASVMQLAAKIEQGEFIVMAADRIPVNNPAATRTRPFLGQPAAFPIGPWLLAHALGCPVYFLSSLTDGHGYRVQLQPLYDRLHLPRASREAQLTELIDQLALRLQQLCTEAPYQWFNFYPFWAKPSAADQQGPA